MKKTFWVVAGLLVLLLGYAWFSLNLTLNGVKQAIENKDSVALTEYVDFSKVREHLKVDLNAKISQETQKDKMGLGALVSLPSAFMIDGLVNTIVTPENLAQIGSGVGLALSNLAPNKPTSTNDWSVKRVGWLYVVVSGKNATDSGLILEPSGLGWKVTRLKLGF